jgi:lysophospholipase L1-like esterase
MGDSFTAREGYSNLIADEYPEGEVMRWGFGGTSTENWLPGGGFLQRKPTVRVASILLGANDAVMDKRPADEVVENLRLISDLMLAFGACRIVITTPASIENDWPEANVLLEDYSRAIPNFCNEPNDEIECGPDLFHLLGEGDFLSDGIHPNPQGHAKIAEALLPFLAPR